MMKKLTRLSNTSCAAGALMVSALVPLLVSVLGFAPLVLADDDLTSGTKVEVETLINSSLASNLGFSIIESLTTEVGQRQAGSEAEARARDLSSQAATACTVSSICVNAPISLALCSANAEWPAAESMVP